MILDRKEVEHIAKLACLDLSNEEKDRFRKQLSQILAHFNLLQTLDTSDIPPTYNVLDLETETRSDESRPGLPTDLLLRNAPDAEANQFRVPPVLE